MNWITTENNKPVNLKDIPSLDINDLRKEIINLNKRVVGFFGDRVFDGVKLYVVMADDENGKLYISSSFFDAGQKSYESITKDIPAFHMFEREFF